MKTPIGLKRRTLISIKHQSMDLYLFFQEITVRAHYKQSRVQILCRLPLIAALLELNNVRD